MSFHPKYHSIKENHALNIFKQALILPWHSNPYNKINFHDIYTPNWECYKKINNKDILPLLNDIYS